MIDDPRRTQLMTAQPLALPQAAAQAGHLAVDVSLVEKDQAVRLLAHAGLTLVVPDAAFRSFAPFLQNIGTDCRGILSTTLPTAERISTPVACNQNIIDRLIELKEPGRGDDWIGLRDFALVFLQSETALTTGQLAGLDVLDRPTRHRPVITVRFGRIANRELTVSDVCLKAIDRYLRRPSGHPYPKGPVVHRGSWRAAQASPRSAGSREGS